MDVAGPEIIEKDGENDRLGMEGFQQLPQQMTAIGDAESPGADVDNGPRLRNLGQFLAVQVIQSYGGARDHNVRLGMGLQGVSQPESLFIEGNTLGDVRTGHPVEIPLNEGGRQKQRRSDRNGEGDQRNPVGLLDEHGQKEG